MQYMLSSIKHSIIIRQCLLHLPGFRHLIAAAPAAAVVLFTGSCSIYYLSAGIAALTLKLHLHGRHFCVGFFEKNGSGKVAFTQQRF